MVNAHLWPPTFAGHFCACRPGADLPFFVFINVHLWPALLLDLLAWSSLSRINFLSIFFWPFKLAWSTLSHLFVLLYCLLKA